MPQSSKIIQHIADKITTQQIFPEYSDSMNLYNKTGGIICVQFILPYLITLQFSPFNP